MKYTNMKCLAKIFKILNTYQIKLNQLKCAFGFA